MKKHEIKKVSKVSVFFSKFMLFIVLILIFLIILKSNPSFRNSVYKNVFQNNLKFAKINELYEKYFGSSLPLTGNKSNLSLVSSEKLEYEDYKDYKDGVSLKVSDGYAVPALKNGIVVFVGEKEGYGNTIVVQGADDVEIWYSNLKEIKLSMYDYLKKGAIIGEVSDNKLILVFSKDGKKIDYKKYI